jgi:hypothetical protein
MRRQSALEGVGQEGGRKERGSEYPVQKMIVVACTAGPFTILR